MTIKEKQDLLAQAVNIHNNQKSFEPYRTVQELYLELLSLLNTTGPDTVCLEDTYPDLKKVMDNELERQNPDIPVADNDLKEFIEGADESPEKKKISKILI